MGCGGGGSFYFGRLRVLEFIRKNKEICVIYLNRLVINSYKVRFGDEDYMMRNDI